MMTTTRHLQVDDRGDSHAVHYCNGVYMGDFIVGDDGYFYWWPKHPSNGGCIDAWVLRELADRLDDLNETWDIQLNAFFNDKETNEEQN